MTESVDKSPLSASGLPPAPTTKILAMGQLASPLTQQQRQTVGAKEVPETLRLYLAGKIDQWWYRQDGNGVVFVLNETSVNEAGKLVESLPLSQEKLMRFELFPLGPLAPLHALLREPTTNDQYPDAAMTTAEKSSLAETFIAAIRSRDGQALASIMAEEVVWSLPGTSQVSGEARGINGILKRAETLARYRVNIEIQHVVFGFRDIGLLLHNTGNYGDRELNEHLTTVLQLQGRKIHRLDTYISDVDMLNRYFA